MEKCPCASGKSYDECCGPFLQGAKEADTAEELMRARYSAFVRADIDYLYKTVSPDQQKDFNIEETKDWAQNSEWKGLEIIETVDGGPDDEKGTVEFVASFRQNKKDTIHHELASFEKIDGKWIFMDGVVPKPKQVIRETPKVGRNDPCPCGSGLKYKKCCGK
ncbi:MAG: YchJ family protein [Deltaproteobacteria bacterium]|nr:YchJ family protein [Deltaproteobacteria bacterium]